MRNIKTYEGFFDFLKKKKGVPFSILDIEECFYDIIDDDRIKSQLTGNFSEVIIPNDSRVFYGREGLSLSQDHQELMDDLLGVNNTLSLDGKFTVKNNLIATKISYYPNDISDQEVSDILSDVSNKLKIYGCDVTYFIGWGSDEGSCSYKEWKDFDKMISKTVESIPHSRNIVIKINPNRNIT